MLVSSSSDKAESDAIAGLCRDHRAIICIEVSGRIEIGSPSMNFFKAQLSADGHMIELSNTETLPLPNDGAPDYGGKEVIFGIRPEHFKIDKEGAGTMQIRVDHVEILGADTLIHGHTGEDNTFLTVRLPDIHHFEKSTVLPLAVPSQKLHLFDMKSENRIVNSER